MARLVVTDLARATEAPFLRGILTRSLQQAGMSFEEAYGLSSEIRQDLLKARPNAPTSERIELSLRKLEAVIIKTLRRSGRQSTVERYRARRTLAAPFVVQHKDGHITPFSRAQHQRGLESCGLSAEESASVTRSLYERLLADNKAVVASYELDRLTHACLARDLNAAVAQRYLVWRDFVLSGRPLLLLVGGTAGCGKSTAATAIASRLGIVRTQSTDMLREVMRVMLPPRLLPVLHRSSFDAWKVLPRAESGALEDDTLLADGYRAQADLISVACEAVVQRAIRERVSLILEGVHVQPSLLERIPTDSDAVVVPIMLAVLNPDTLRARIRGRGVASPDRRSARYLNAFDGIWGLQSHLLSEADKAGIAIVRNLDEERVFVEIMRVVLDTLSVGFRREPDEVFTPPADADTVADGQ